MEKAGIYVHIPFCRSKCPYCDFFSLANTERAADYVAAVNAALSTFFAENSCKADTLYIGGGTPSVLRAEQVASIIRTAEKCCENALVEITVECNPSDVSEAFLREIFAAGANRLSFGMQSAVDSERRALGRRADRAAVQSAVQTARKVGFRNISLDLMLGIPKQDAHSLTQSIRFCAQLGVEHVSAYLLKLEEGTPFYRNAAKLSLPDEDSVADLYLQAVRALEAEGFRQYEISNFAKEGFESRHNLKYWLGQDYVGFGAAAHSFFGDKRFYYPRDIDSFIAGREPVQDGEGGSREERIMLGLRLNQGIETAILSDRAKEQLPFLCEKGLARVFGSRVALTAEGFLISNTIINLLIEE